MNEDIDALLARMLEDASRSPREVIDADEASAMSEADFDDALWLSLAGVIGSVDDLRPLSPGVRMYFATRLVEWEVGNGGFRQAVHNACEYFDEAERGYELLGQAESAALMREAAEAGHDGPALDALDERVMNDAPWKGVPWADGARVAYVRAHRDEFRL